MEQKEAYLKDPCRVSSIPYWKAEQFPVPEGVRILHDSEFQAEDCGLFEDEPYFRLKHDLQHLARAVFAAGLFVLQRLPARFCGAHQPVL